MATTKTLYIRSEDAWIWELVEKRAKETKQSVSQLVAEALQKHVLSDAQEESEFAHIHELIADIQRDVAKLQKGLK